MSKVVRIGGAAAGSVAGAEEFQRFLTQILPQQVIDDTRRALDGGADRMVVAIKAAAPVSDLETHPGELRDSVHKENGRHDLSVLVVEDAADPKGHGYAPHVEYGHKTRDGGHVAPVPHFWPAVRAERKAIAAEIKADMRRAARGAP